MCSCVVLEYRERSVSVYLSDYFISVLYWSAESVLSVCGWRYILERCGIRVQNVVSLCVAGGLFCSGVNWSAESSLSVWSWLSIVYRCDIVVQRVVCQCVSDGVFCNGVVLECRVRSVSVYQL